MQHGIMVVACICHRGVCPRGSRSYRPERNGCGRAGRAGRAGVAGRALGAGGASRSGIPLGALRPGRPGLAFGADRALFADGAFRARDALCPLEISPICPCAVGVLPAKL